MLGLLWPDIHLNIKKDPIHLFLVFIVHNSLMRVSLKTKRFVFRIFDKNVITTTTSEKANDNQSFFESGSLQFSQLSTNSTV